MCYPVIHIGNREIIKLCDTGYIVKKKGYRAKVGEHRKVSYKSYNPSFETPLALCIITEIIHKRSQVMIKVRILKERL